jgi:MFS family permease
MDLANIPSNKSNGRRSSEQPQQEQRQKFRWWIVLPVIVVSMTTTSANPVLLNDLIVRRYRNQYGLINASSPASETECNTENLQNDSTIAALSTKVQESVSHLNILMAGVGAIPAVVTYIILGANCDRIGRRPLLIIPCIGRIIHFIILLLVVKLNLSDAWLIVSNCIDGLFGSNSVLLLGAIAYISDCTSPNERSRALVLEEAAVALTRIFPLLGLGFWLQDHGYTLPISIDLGINVAALIYIFLFQPESCGENNRHIFYFFKQLKKIRLTPIRGTYRVFLIKRDGHVQRTMIIITLIQMLLFIVLFGFVSIQPLYLYGKPFCFNVLNLAILTSAQFSLMIVIAIILSFFQKTFIMNSMIAPFIGIGTYIIHLVLFGVADAIWFLYLGKNRRKRNIIVILYFF